MYHLNTPMQPINFLNFKFSTVSKKLKKLFRFNPYSYKTKRRKYKINFSVKIEKKLARKLAKKFVEKNKLYLLDVCSPYFVNYPAILGFDSLLGFISLFGVSQIFQVIYCSLLSFCFSFRIKNACFLLGIQEVMSNVSVDFFHRYLLINGLSALALYIIVKVISSIILKKKVRLFRSIYRAIFLFIITFKFSWGYFLKRYVLVFFPWVIKELLKVLYLVACIAQKLILFKFYYMCFSMPVLILIFIYIYFTVKPKLRPKVKNSLKINFMIDDIPFFTLFMVKEFVIMLLLYIFSLFLVFILYYHQFCFMTCIILFNYFFFTLKLLCGFFYTFTYYTLLVFFLSSLLILLLLMLLFLLSSKQLALFIVILCLLAVMTFFLFIVMLLNITVSLSVSVFFSLLFPVLNLAVVFFWKLLEFFHPRAVSFIIFFNFYFSQLSDAQFFLAFVSFIIFLYQLKIHYKYFKIFVNYSWSVFAILFITPMLSEWYEW